jgi:phosphoglycerate kinase
MNKLTDAPINNQTKVIVRCDLDVPIKNGVVQEKYRLEAGLPTLKYLKDKGARIIIMGHIGRPDGKAAEELSTKQLRPYYDEQLGAESYELLENLRFDSREEANDPTFAQELASQADIYVNESFATSHRSHASMTGITKFLPSFAGLRLEKEVENLSKVLKSPERPLIAIIGGAKLESKKPVISKFLKIADTVMLGGKMGLSWKEDVPNHLWMPWDYGEDQKDVGPRTIDAYVQKLLTAKTVVWSGPLGAFEEVRFALGTMRIAEAVINSKAFSVVGGGDTINALSSSGMLNKFSFVSSGGSAMLDFISEGNLPALEVLGYNG